MEWMFPQWWIGPSYGTPYGLSTWPRGDFVAPPATGEPVDTPGDAWPAAHPRPSDDDLWLIGLVYETVAAESGCTRCGASLRHAVRLTPALASCAGTWGVVVTARCAGWRRHRHVADVTEASSDLVLGRFRAAEAPVRAPGRFRRRRA